MDGSPGDRSRGRRPRKAGPANVLGGVSAPARGTHRCWYSVDAICQPAR